MGPACGILYGSSSCAHQFSHHSCTSTHLHTDLDLPTSSSPHLFLVTSHTSSPALSNGTLYTFDLYSHRFFSKKKFQNLLMISLRFLLRTQLFDFSLFYPNTYRFPHVLLHIHPTPPFTSYPPRRRLLCIVLRLLGDCPRAGLFAAATLCRLWNSVATTAWLGLALAATYAFYAVFASPSQDKLSEI